MKRDQHTVEAMTFTITESIAVKAPLERCFALSTRVELVRETLGMRPIDGVTMGHVSAGSRVVWRGWKFGLPTEHHTLITHFERPHDDELPSRIPGASSVRLKSAYFIDEQERGRFASFSHVHGFRQKAGEDTLLFDRVQFSLPFGWAGRLVGRWIVAPHAQRLVRERFALIKKLAESDGWREYVAAG